MILEAVLDYWGVEVGTFDPEKVLARMRSAFPQLTSDFHDHANDEVENVVKSLKGNCASESTEAAIKRQIQGKTRRNGPVYRFKIRFDSGELIEGMTSRYSVQFTLPDNANSATLGQIENFLRELDLGRPEVLRIS
jgi:hypothetical protein